MGLANSLIVKAHTTEEEKNLVRLLGGSRAEGILIGINEGLLSVFLFVSLF